MFHAYQWINSTESSMDYAHMLLRSSSYYFNNQSTHFILSSLWKICQYHYFKAILRTTFIDHGVKLKSQRISL